MSTVSVPVPDPVMESCARKASMSGIRLLEVRRWGCCVWPFACDDGCRRKESMIWISDSVRDGMVSVSSRSSSADEGRNSGWKDGSERRATTAAPSEGSVSGSAVCGVEVVVVVSSEGGGGC